MRQTAMLSPRGCQVALGAREIFGGIDSGWKRRWRDADTDAESGFERAQLFQRFDPFEPALWQGGELFQETGAVTVDADVPQPGISGRKRVAIARERIARPRHRRTAEIERVAIGRAHQFDHVRVE